MRSAGQRLTTAGKVALALVGVLLVGSALLVRELTHGAEPPLATETAPALTAVALSASAHEMVVADLVRERNSRGVVLILKEKGRERFLLLTIGDAEARAIALQLEGTVPERPLTHDLLANALREVQAPVVRVVVTELRDGTYYAQVVVRVEGREVGIDSRPSDAVALALRAQAPIYAEGALLERAALTAEQPF
jgi:bifunctional DNase/RNase